MWVWHPQCIAHLQIFNDIVFNIIHWQREKKYAHNFFKLPRETQKIISKLKNHLVRFEYFFPRFVCNNNKKFIFSLKQCLYIHAICYQQKQQSKVQLPKTFDLPHPHPHLISLSSHLNKKNATK